MNTHTRNIKLGEQYNKLIPPPKNRKVFLGSGDTFLSLKNMVRVIFETLDDTKQLADQLAGQSVQETVKNIKNFIYWHIQYKQDETDQELHSPAHTWSVRTTGVDCKSYSIFVSSILTNLGIANSLRQIKQLVHNPDYWTHVYVVLPGYDLVIDGTVDYNHEPTHAEKYDEPILQAGLKGLSQIASYCNWSCNPQNNNNNNSNNSNENRQSTNEGGRTGGARLPFRSIADLLADIQTANKTKQVRYNGSSLVSGSDNRLRLAKAKAKARIRKIKLLKLN